MRRRCAVCGEPIKRASVTGLCRVHLAERRAAPRRRPTLRRKALSARFDKPVQIELPPHPGHWGDFRTVQVDPIVRKVGSVLEIDPALILSDKRWSILVDARAAVAVAMRKRGASYPYIGKALGRDHTSILHLVRTFDARVAVRPYLSHVALEAAA